MMSTIGMLCALYCCAIIGASSTLTLTTLTLPAMSWLNLSSTGAIIRHGPHHGAHRSTTTKALVSIAAAKSVSPASTSQGRLVLHLAQRGWPPAATGRRFFVPQDGHATTGLAMAPIVGRTSQARGGRRE